MPSDTYTLIVSDSSVNTPAAGSVTSSSVASDAAIAFSKLAALTNGNILVGNGSNVPTSVAVTGNVTLSNTGVTTIANDAVTFAKMQNVAGYSILAKPTSGSGDVAEVASTDYMLAASTGFLRQADATSARSTLGLTDAVTGNALLSGGVSTAPVYGKVGLTTHVVGTLPAANGGTGQASYAIGDIAYASGATTLSKLADVATGNALLSGGVGVAPAYGKVGLTTHVDGTLPAANGGTGQTSYAIGDITYASGATTLSKLADVATGNALLSGGVGAAPAYGKVGLTTHVDGTLPAANGGTGQTSYAIGDIIYASGATALSKLADVSTGSVLISGGVGVAPAYGKVGLTTHVSGTLPAASGGTGQTSYTIGDITYASSATTLAKLADVATGNALLSGGVGAAPVYGKVGLTTHVDGILPAANGGSGSAALDNVLLSAGVGVASTYGKVGLATHVSGTLPAANGGTGHASYTIGDITFASGATTLSKLADVATGSVLISGGVGVAPAYGKVGLTTHVDGTLPAASGGTGQTSYAIGDIPYASGATTLSKLADVATGNALLSGGVGVAPAYGKVGLTTHVDGILPVANGGTGISGLGTGVATFLATPSSANLAAAVTGETGSGALVFASSPSLIAPVLGTPAAGSVLTNCTGLPLTTGVTGILPVAYGGTNQVSVARGQISKMTSFTAVPVAATGTYYPLENGGTLDTTVSTNMILGATSTFSIRNTSGVTRVFRIYASVDATASNDDILGIKLYAGVAGSLSARDETECRAFTNTVNDAAKLATSWMISLANNEEVAVYVANHSVIQNITAQRARIVAEAVL